MMATVSWHLVLTLVSSLIVSCSSRLSVGQDGGYENIVVAIAPNIPETDGAELIVNLRNLFDGASHFLHNATNQLTYFKSVTFLIPSNWTSVPYDKVSRDESFHAADVKITTTNSTKGAFSTVQPNCCGQPGEFIQISQEAFNSQDNAARIRQLVQHWAKYRYGVFEENGEEGSDIYPADYVGENGVLKTGCALPYPWKPKDINCPKNCSFEPDGDPPTTSVMDFRISESYRFCDAKTHNQEAPTIHNTLCGQRNVLDVIRNSLDLKNLSRSVSKSPAVHFTTVIANWTRLVIIGDPYLCNDGIDIVLQKTFTSSIAKFIYYVLPTNFGVLSLSAGDSTEDKPLDFAYDPVDRHTRWDILACRDLPTSNNRDIRKVVDQALKVLSDGGNILLLVNGEKTSTDDLVYAANVSKEEGVHLYVFTYPQLLFQNLTDNWITMAQRREVKWFNIPWDKNAVEKDYNAWKQIDDALLDLRNDISPGFSGRTVLTYSAIPPSKSEIKGNFFVNDHETLITFSLNSAVDKNFDLKLWLNDEEWKKVLQNAKVQKTGVYSMETTLKAGAYSFTINDTNLARFKNYFFSIFLSSNDDQPLPQIVTAIDQTDENYVVLRVVVPSSGVTVKPAEVTAMINNASPIIINDMGQDGDYLAHDGVYSHFFQPETKGIYSIEYTIKLYEQVQNGIHHYTASDNPSTPLTIKKQDSFVFQGNSSIDTIPPSRITDLKAETCCEEGESYKATFTWTAPGDDFNTGIVSKYELKCSMNRSFVAIGDDFSSTDVHNIMNITSVVKPANEKDTIVWDQKMELDKWYFCAIRAADEANNYNLPSNVETSYVQKPPTTIATTTPVPPTQPTTATSSLNSTDSSFITPIDPTNINTGSTTVSPPAANGDTGGLETWIIIVIAVVCLLFLILLAVLVWFLRFRKRKSSTAPDSETDRSSNKNARRSMQNNQVMQLDNSDVYGDYPSGGTGSSGDRRLNNGGTLNSNFRDSVLSDNPTDGRTKNSNMAQQNALHTPEERRSSVISEYASYMPEKDNQAFEMSMGNDLYATGGNLHTVGLPNSQDDKESRGYLAAQTRRTSLGSNVTVPEGINMNDPVYSEVDKSKKTVRNQPNAALNKNIRTITPV